MEEIERSAASVEEALEAALDELGISEQEADIRVVHEPKSGFLGLKSQPAVVRVRPKPGVLTAGEPGPAGAGRAAGPGRARDAESTEGESDESSGDSSEIEAEPELEEQAEVVMDFLEGLFEVMDLEADLDSQVVDGTMYVDIWGIEGSDDMGLLIGKRGHTLDALQDIVRGFVQRESGERCAVLVDVEDYRKRRRRQIESRARQIAQNVKRTGRSEGLEPMNAFERKIVHDAVARFGGLETSSEGEEPNRRVVIRRPG
jgi:spoIIIJ-associated protein